MAQCSCHCHNETPKRSMCMCCTDAAQPWLTPPSKEDKSKEILDSIIKGRK